MINTQQLYNRVYTTSTQHTQLLYFLLTRFSNEEARYHLVEYGDYVDDMSDGIMGILLGAMCLYEAKATIPVLMASGLL